MASETPQFVYVMAFTGPHLDEARNELASLEKSCVEMRGAPPPEIHIYTQLREGNELGGLGVRVFELKLPGVDVESAEADWGTTGFSHIVVGKFEALLKTLKNKPDAHIVWLDTDLFFFKDPREELISHAARFPHAIAHFQKSSGPKVCTGFFYLPPSHRRAQKELLVRAMGRLLAHNSSTSRRRYKGDEACINEELACRTGMKRKYTFSFLETRLFPNGQDFFDRKQYSREEIILVHNNFIKGLAAKIQRFKEHGFWII